MPQGRRAAAVLIPIVEIDNEWKVILTERSKKLKHHAGQISFPGGAIDAEESVIDAALREAHEEIGLNPNLVEVIGHLPGVITTANFHIAPVLGIIREMPDLMPEPEEVARIIALPLQPLLSPSNHRQEDRINQGKTYQTWVIDHQDEYIWGATAKLIVQWSQRLPGEITGSMIQRG